MQLRHFEKILLPFDLLSLSLAWYLTIFVRLSLNRLFQRQLTYEELVQVAPPLAGILFLWTVTVLLLNLVRSRDDSAGTGLSRVGEATLMAGLLAIVVTFFSRNLGSDLSRSHILFFLPVSFVTLIGGRYLCLLALNRIDPRWSGAERVAFIGDTLAARAVVDRINGAKRFPVKVAGIIVPEQASTAWGNGDDDVPILGTTTKLAEVINQARLTRLVFVGDNLKGSEIDHCVKVSMRMGITFSHAVSSVAPQVKLRIADLGDLRLVEMRPVAFTRGQEVAKRSFDIVSTFTLLLLLSPLLALVAILVRISSPGPVFYVSTRVGRGGRYFTFFKFRTMYHGYGDSLGVAEKNERSGHIFKIRKDPRVTPVGFWLRRWSIDELPQLFNVLRGDMSIVGPRPLPASDLEPDGQSRQFEVWAEQRSRVLPGITGLWQISGRSELPFDRMVQLDLTYIQTWSLKRDLQILLETPKVVFLGRGAY